MKEMENKKQNLPGLLFSLFLGFFRVLVFLKESEMASARPSVRPSVKPAKPSPTTLKLKILNFPPSKKTNQQNTPKQKEVPEQMRAAEHKPVVLRLGTNPCGHWTNKWTHDTLGTRRSPGRYTTANFFFVITVDLPIELGLVSPRYSTS